MSLLRQITLFLLVALAVPSALASKMYKWTDADGNVHYSSSLPPEQARQGHSRLNEQGVGVEQKDRAKTPEEIAREQELERLRAEQQRLIDEQRAKDQVLLRTFRSEDDIVLTRDGKIATFDTQIRLTQKNINMLKTRLLDQQTQAANWEKQGRPLTQNHLDSMEGTRREIEDSYASILRREEAKEEIMVKYGADLERFRELKSIEIAPLESTAKENKINLVDTAIPCTDAQQCDSLWSKGVSYASSHAMTRVQVDTQRLWMTLPPKEDNEFGLTLSRIKVREEGPEVIFLDVQCSDSIDGRERCKKPDIVELRGGFKSALE